MSSPSPPRLSLPSDLEAPSPTYSPNSAASSPRSTSIRGNSFQKITQILGYSSNPESQPSTPLPQEPQQNHPSSPAEEAQDTSVGDESFDEKKRNSKRSSNVNENGYADEKKKRNSYRFSMDDFRKSFIDVKDLRRPINYSYIGTIVLHVVLLLFFAIVLGVRGIKQSGFDTAIPPLNLDIKQSAINLVTGGFGVLLTALVATLAQRAATHRLFERRQDLTFLSDSLAAWVSPFGALKSLLNHATEQIKQDKLTVELVFVSIYLVLTALMGAIFTSIFTLGVYDSSISTLAPMVPSNLVAFSNISTAGFFGAGRWNTMASAVYTNQLQNQSHIPGFSHNRMYSYLDTQSSSISGSVMSPATDVDVKCKSFHDFNLTVGTVDLDGLVYSKLNGYPIIVETQFMIDGTARFIKDSIPWKPCSQWAETDAQLIRTGTLNSNAGGNSLSRIPLQHPTAFLFHYSCTKDPAPQNCSLNGCNPLRDSDGVWAHTTELLPYIKDQNTTWPNVLQTESDSQGHLEDFGLAISVLACTATATKADSVKVTVPENTIDDFPDPNEKIQSRGWSVYQDPQDGDEEVDISNSLFRFGDMLDPLGAPLYASITPNNPIDPPELIDPNFDCFTNTRTCHPSTLVEHYIYSQMAGMQGNTNELAALELALQNVTTTALSNAASFIRNVNGTKELNPNSGDQTANMANFQNFVLPAQKAVQRTKLSLNKWPLIIGICGACITLVIAFLLLRPLPEGTPFVRGTELIHITRLLSLSDIPERMRTSPSSFHGMRQHGRFPTRLDGGGSTLMSEAALLSSSVAPNTLPIISPSRTGFTHSVSFRDRNAKSGLDLVEA